MSDERDIRPGETLEWMFEQTERSNKRMLAAFGGCTDSESIRQCGYTLASAAVIALAREALRYRAAGVVPAREVECKRCDGHGMEVYGDYIAESCRKCDGYGQILEFVEEARDETDR